MFCYQCEQTAQGKGCERAGVCGKDHVTATMQDALIHLLKGIGLHAIAAGEKGLGDAEAGIFVLEALFTTITNVDFDPDRIEPMVRRAVVIRDRLAGLNRTGSRAASHLPVDPATWNPPADRDGLLVEAERFSIARRKEVCGERETGLEELVTQGLKGAAAYADHAHVLGFESPGILADFLSVLGFLATGHDTEELLEKALAVGELNFRVMELLDRANTTAYGHPVPTKVRVTPRKASHAILVSGHDLKDLEALLEQTSGRGIDVYTHGEMLPAHGYPGLRKHPHLAGNYGSAWQNQQKEFDEFPGAILMTTNCIQKPRPGYFGRIFTSGLAAWPGVRHISDRNFAPLIEAALAQHGFAEDAPEQSITVGFARNAVLSVAPAVIDAVKAGAIRHFFLIGGCDGAKSGRDYYTELAEKVPDDCVILTLACGKYRFNKLDFGHIGGIPRLLDVGQCNDAYSAIRIALALAEAFGVDVNSLPLSLVLSWYEQKASAILLTLLHLGIRRMRLGPTLPACLTPDVIAVLREKFEIMPITTPDEDLKAILG
ncbi:hydroxylamine reductase [Candidatus Fermentibacteria bacterium]|nr:hydroxylamine reductase [Candidatus Fermentibacteria bacterium]